MFSYAKNETSCCLATSVNAEKNFEEILPVEIIDESQRNRRAKQ